MELTVSLFFQVAVTLGLLLLLWYWPRRPRRLSELGDKFPGPPGLPIVGNIMQLWGSTSDIFYAFLRISNEFYGTPYKIWGGNQLFVLLTVPADVEIIMGSNIHIDKSDPYDLFHVWLGTGLLTSTGTKWRRNRKILTPTFHFKILEEFIGTFLANGEILVKCLEDKVDGPGFDIHHYITLNSLDNICENTMGIKINAQKDAECEYVHAVHDMATILTQKSLQFWLQNDRIFKFSSLKAKQDKALRILHGTTERVIKSRREEIQKDQAANGSSSSSQVSEDGRKRRLAFLDLLIQSQLEGSEMTDENIREEVDTFMFEGHDTTAAGLTFTIWLLSWHQDIQDAVCEEIQQVWPDNSEPLTYQQLQELKLLERVIKESLRLYPSVPVYGRKLTEDVVLSGGLVAPAGANVHIISYMVHRDPEIFPDPEKFDPDRFLPENVRGRHPYAYIPFSAGPRNCIGQKFAMLQMKSTLVQVLSKYKFSPASTNRELKLSFEVTLKAKDGVPVTIERRNLKSIP